MNEQEIAKLITMAYYAAIWLLGVALGMSVMWWIVQTTPDLIETKEPHPREKQ